MAKRPIASTSLDDRLPTRFLEGDVHSYRPQIVRHLRARGMAMAADLLAEPRNLPDRIEWLTDLPGEATPLSAFPAVQQAASAATVVELVAAIRAEADRLSAAGSDSQRLLADVLRRSAEGGEPGDIWRVVDGGSVRHVLAGWGLSAPAGRPPIPDLVASLAARKLPFEPLQVEGAPTQEDLPPRVPPPLRSDPPISSPGTTVPVRAWPLRLLALSALLLLLAGLLSQIVPMLTAVFAGLRLPSIPPCEVVASPNTGLALLQQEETRLRARMAELERAFSGQVLQCRMTQPPRPEQRAESDADQRLRRENARSGRFQVTLLWDGPADLDLHVDCPGGERVSQERSSACGARLDVDMNARGGRRSDSPVENVVWAASPASGTYRVRVVYYDYAERRTPVPFRVRVTTDGALREVTGVATHRDEVPVAEFTVP